MYTSDDRYVLLVGDAHGNRSFMKASIERAAREGIGRILQLGDFGVWPGLEGVEFLASVETNARKHGVRVDFIEGNHDDYTQLESWFDHNERDDDGSVIVKPHIRWWPRGSVVDWNDRRIGFLGGAVSVDRQGRWPYESWWPQEAITWDDVATLQRNCHGESLDVLFTHDTTNFVPLPSRRSWPEPVLADAAASRDKIDDALVRLEPALLVHGHWHIRYRTTITVGTSDVNVEGLGCEHPVLGTAVLDLDGLAVSGQAQSLEKVIRRND